MIHLSPLLATFLAVGRRFLVGTLIALGSVLAETAFDVIPQQLIAALQSNPATVGWVGIAWLVIEFVQKYLREKKGWQ